MRSAAPAPCGERQGQSRQGQSRQGQRRQARPRRRLPRAADTQPTAQLPTTAWLWSGSVAAPTPATEPLDRVEKALALVDRDGLGLELGPSHSPIAPKRQGYRVHTVDHLTAEELRAKYTGHPVDLQAIEEVDFVWHGEPLPELVGGTARYDWIVASHVLEHIPDPVAFLDGCARILRPGGVLSLILPDMRCCFDQYMPLTTTGQWLDAHHQGRMRPTPGQVFDHHADAIARQGRIAWPLGDPAAPNLVHELPIAADLWRRARDGDEYIDSHLWRFVPASFRLLVQDLRDLGLTELVIKRDWDTVGHEFHAVLGTGLPHIGRVDRLATLARLSRLGDTP